MAEDKETPEKKLARFKTETAEDYDAIEDLRDACAEDMRFRNVVGGMWEDWQSRTHGNGTNRAKLEFDIVSEYVNRFIGEWTQNRSGPLFEPDGDDTTEDDSEMLNGIYRADFKDSDGVIGVDNGVEEMAECGIGAFQLSTQFKDEDDPENENQDIIFDPLYNSYDHVIWDANSKRIDKADAKHCTKLTTYTENAFNDEFPDAEPISAYEPDNRGFTWNTPKLITVASRYEVKKEKLTVHVYENLELGQVQAYEAKDIDLIKDELADEGWEFVRERVLERNRVYKSIFSGAALIEDEKLIAGRFIPIIPIYGYRKFIDGQEHVKGLVRPLKDPNRLFNSSISRIADDSASSPNSIPVLDEDQIDGVEDSWENRHQKSYLKTRSREDAEGNKIPTNQEIGYIQPNQLDPNTITAAELTNNFIQRMTGNAPQDQIDPDASGVAIEGLRKRENLSTQTLSDHIELAMKHCGKVYLGIFNDITTGARSKRSLGEDGKVSIVKLNNHVMDEETGRFVVGNDLSKKRFKVNVVSGPQYETQKEATIQTIERIIGIIKDVKPQYIDPLIGSWVTNIDGPGLKALKKFNRNQMLLGGLEEPETDEEIAMLEAAGQQTNPQDELAAAATKQQEAEAMNLAASAENKQADTQKKKAETEEILAGLPGKKLEQVDKVVDISQKRAQNMMQRFAN